MLDKNMRSNLYETLMRSISKSLQFILNENFSGNDFLTKTAQEELKQQYVQGLTEYFEDIVARSRHQYNYQKEIDYHLKNIAYFIPICNGKYIVPLKKERIQKEFSFGYSCIGLGETYEETRKNINNAEKYLEDFFIDKNLLAIDDQIENILSALSGLANSHYLYCEVYYGNPRRGMDEESAVKEYVIDRGYGFYMEEHFKKMEKDDIQKLLLTYEKYKEDFTKQLYTYLKKYGTSKLYINSYCSDD